MSAPAEFYNYPLHREKRGWVKPSDCEWCARESHPSNVGRTPANLAHWDQVAAREREESAAGGRALATVLLVLLAFGTAVPGALNFWAWFTNLSAPTVHHFAWLPLFALSALAVYGLYRIGKP